MEGATLQLEGKRFIVTGAGRGIGRAVADAFVSEGAAVVRFDIDFTGDPDAGHGTRVLCDVSSREHVEEAVETAAADLGGLDGLVNAAGIERRRPAEEISDEDWQQMLDVHLKGTFLTNQAVFPHLTRHGGRIINFGSHAGLIPVVNHAHYAAAKGGVIAWTRSILDPIHRPGVGSPPDHGELRVAGDPHADVRRIREQALCGRTPAP